jgi:hypothetical protein
MWWCVVGKYLLIFWKFIVVFIFRDKQYKNNGLDYEIMDCLSLKMRATAIFQNVRIHSASNTAPHPKRLKSLATLLCELQIWFCVFVRCLVSHTVHWRIWWRQVAMFILLRILNSLSLCWIYMWIAWCKLECLLWLAQKMKGVCVSSVYVHCEMYLDGYWRVWSFSMFISLLYFFTIYTTYAKGSHKAVLHASGSPIVIPLHLTSV